jgi:hemoglobin
MKGRPSPQRTVVIDGKPLPEMLDDAMIETVVHGFYDSIRTDDLLGPIFNGVIPAENWPRHLARMCDFWSATLLRTDRYEGRPLPPHLAMTELQAEHFHRWLSLFRETVERICPPDIAALFLDRAMRIAHSFRLAIAFHRGESSIALTPITSADLCSGPGAMSANSRAGDSL